MNQTVHRDKQYQNRASLTNPKQLSVLFNYGLFEDEGSGRCREDTWFESAVSYLFCNDRYLQIPKKPQRNMRNKEYDTLAFPISYLESRQKHAYKVSKSTSKYCITEQPNFLKYEWIKAFFLFIIFYLEMIILYIYSRRISKKKSKYRINALKIPS